VNNILNNARNPLAVSSPSAATPTRIATVSDGSGWILSGAVAWRLGIQTGTLKKWRSLGRGPAVWKRVSTTVVVYLVSSVTDFEQTWEESFERTTNSPRKGGGPTAD
jgi:hypothetical protein